MLCPIIILSWLVLISSNLINIKFYMFTIHYNNHVIISTIEQYMKLNIFYAYTNILLNFLFLLGKLTKEYIFKA